MSEEEKDYEYIHISTESDSSTGSENIDDSKANDMDNDMKFIVFFSCLVPLLQRCLTCNSPAVIKNIFTKGTALCVKLLCHNNHLSSWCSQPQKGAIYLGNLLVAASIVFSGGTYKVFSDMANILLLQMIKERTFYAIQEKYIFGAVNKVYKVYRNLLLHQFIDKPAKLGGDGRCDSPGHNAKYCTYSVMEQESSQILHFHITSVEETDGKSNLMEKQALVRVLEKLSQENVSIESLTTDRHPQIRKHLRENTSIRHQFDIWHAAKSLRKKLTNAAKSKANAELQAWIKSIDNHFWWCCLTCNGNLEELMEKWLSLLQHICGFHEFPNNNIFKRCEHGNIDREWLTPTSSSYIALKRIVTEKLFISDMKYFVDFLHTGNLEVFHSLLLKYCPKRLQFSFHGMITRTQLAILHFNQAMKSEHAVTEDGTPRYKLQYSKISKKYVVKPIKNEPEKLYLKDLISEVINATTTSEMHKPILPHIPNRYIDKPDKEEEIKKRYSRFHSKQ